MAHTVLDEAARASARAELGDWDVSTSALTRTVAFPTFLVAVEFIDRMARVAEEMDHHPDLALSWRTVALTLSTHSAGGVTEADLALARGLDRIIAELTSAG
jgi:4a-hydroxytetrahydrobiopterin dehydratase